MATLTQRSPECWQAKIRRKGWPGLSKTFTTKAEAETWARGVESAMDNGSFKLSEDSDTQQSNSQ